MVPGGAVPTTPSMVIDREGLEVSIEDKDGLRFNVDSGAKGLREGSSIVARG